MTINHEETIIGLVLKNKPYKDNDMLVWIYTHDYGKLAMVAKGVKKIKSKNAPSCQTLTLSEFTLIPRVGLSKLIKGSPLNYYRHIKEDIILEAYASYFIEFVYKFAQDNDPNKEIYDNLLLAFNCLEEGYNPKLVYLLFNAFILGVTGSLLEVDHCVNCGRQDHIAGVSISSGGFVCLECLSLYDQKLEIDVLKGFRYINKCKLSNIDKLNLSEVVIDELVVIMEAYIDEFTGINFKSRQFIHQFNSL